MDVISMKDIRKSYAMGDSVLNVLKGIDLTVKEGEFLAILGPSGSGKSTLMNMIGCMDSFDSGEYYLSGNAVHKMNDKSLTDLRNRYVGFIFQKYHLIQKYTVLRNVMMPLLLRGLTSSEAEAAARERLISWEWAKEWITSPMSFRAVSSKEQPLQGHWWATQSCSSPMSPQALLTAPQARKF